MPAEQPSLSDEELHLRVAAPLFFEDLVGSHTDTIVEAKNPEAFAAWKEIRQQADREFAALSAETLLEVAREQQSKPFDTQCNDLAEALSRFAAHADIPLEGGLGSTEETLASCAKILQGEREFDFTIEPSSAHRPAPPRDPRFEAGREIDQSRAAYREQTEPALNEFREMSQSARDEFLAEQRQIGKEALRSQTQSIQQTRVQKVDLPEPEPER